MIDSLNLYLEGNKFSPSVLRKMDVIYVDFQFTRGSEVPRSLLYQAFCLHNGGKIQHMAVLFNQSHGAFAKSVHSQSGYTSWHSVMTYIPKDVPQAHVGELLPVLPLDLYFSCFYTNCGANFE